MAKVKINKIREPEGSNFWVLNEYVILDKRIHFVLLCGVIHIAYIQAQKISELN